MVLSSNVAFPPRGPELVALFWQVVKTEGQALTRKSGLLAWVGLEGLSPTSVPAEFCFLIGGDLSRLHQVSASVNTTSSSAP